MSALDQLGLECDVQECDNRIVGLEDGWEFGRGTVCQKCIDYQDRHGHWPDEDADICVECRIDGGAINHDCEVFSGDGVLLQPGDDCPYCDFEAAMTDGGEVGNSDRLEDKLRVLISRLEERAQDVDDMDRATDTANAHANGVACGLRFARDEVGQVLKDHSGLSEGETA